MNLVRKLNDDGSERWVVVYTKDRHSLNERFTTIDAACDFLEDVLMVDTEEVDSAVISLSLNNDNWAMFDSENKFSHSIKE